MQNEQLNLRKILKTKKSQPEVWGDFCDQMIAENADVNPEKDYTAGNEVVAAMFNAGR